MFLRVSWKRSGQSTENDMFHGSSIDTPSYPLKTRINAEREGQGASDDELDRDEILKRL